MSGFYRAKSECKNTIMTQLYYLAWFLQILVAQEIHGKHPES